MSAGDMACAPVAPSMMALPSEPPADLRERLAATLGGRYVLGGELGAGGMARVFAATETATGRRVAVKVLAPAVTACCDAQRFRREMALVGMLDHPHIVPLLAECERCGGERLFYFVMPFVGRDTLRARLDREGALSVPDAVHLLRQIASALAYAHARGVVHRDIKPANVLLAGGDHALVADFGIAKAIAAAADPPSADVDGCGPGCETACATTNPGDVTSVGVAVGSLAYMAPEQAAADPATDHRADLYALGVLAYEMLTGAGPFHGRPPGAIMKAHLAEVPAPLRERRPEVPTELADLVARLLEKRPEDRPRDAGAVLDALEATDRARGAASVSTAFRAP